MAQKEKEGYMIPQKAGAYVEGLKLLQEYRDKLFEAYDKAFGEWDGVFSEDRERASRREVEEIVAERVLKPVEEYFKQKLAEEITVGFPYFK